MGTKAKLSTKALSLFLAVLMAAGCFSIALPSLAPVALAAADKEITALTNALQAAVDGGYLGTANYAVTRDGNNVSVDDETGNGYLYAVVRAVADVYAKVGTSENSDHGILVLNYIKEKITLNQYQEKFISDLLFAGLYPMPEEDNIPYNYYKDTDDTVWTGLDEDVTGLPDSVTLTMTATRTAKAAMLTDYNDVNDVPAEGVQTKYVLTVQAVKKTEAAADAGYTKVWYENTSATVTDEKAAAPAGVEAIKAYVNYINGETFMPYYNKWVASRGASLYEEDPYLATRLVDFQSKSAAAAAVDSDLLNAYIDVELMNGDYKTFAEASAGAVGAVSLIPYADWIKGENVPAALDANSINKNDFDITDYARMEALIEQATRYLTILRGNTGDVPSTNEESLKEYYGYDTGAYKTYIADMQSKLELYKLTLIKDALDFLYANEGDKEYTFPADSIFNGGATPVTETAPDEKKAYFIRKDNGNGTYTYEAVDYNRLLPVTELYLAKEEAYEITTDLTPDPEKTYYTRDLVYNKVKTSDLPNYTLTDLYVQVQDSEGNVFYEQNTSAEAAEGVTYYEQTVQYNAVDQGRFVTMDQLFEAEDVTYTLTTDVMPVEGVTYFVRSGEEDAYTYTPANNYNILTKSELYDRVYNAVTATEPTEGVVYYVLTDGIYTKVSLGADGFEDGVTYYVSTDSFRQNTLELSELLPDKLYYSRSADGTEYYEIYGRDVLDIRTLYVANAGGFLPTTDEHIVAGKTYYTYNEGTGSYDVKDGAMVYEDADLYVKLDVNGDDAYVKNTEEKNNTTTYYARRISYAEIDAQAYLNEDASHTLAQLYLPEVDGETGEPTGNYVPCPDTAVAENRTYYVQNVRYDAVRGKDLVDFSTCYTVALTTVYGVANRSYYSQAYTEHGLTSPMSYDAVGVDIAWFASMLSMIRAASKANLIKVFNESKNRDSAEFDDTAKLYLGNGSTVCPDIAGANDAQSEARGWIVDVYNDLVAEKDYRKATETANGNSVENIDTFLSHYQYFVDHMLLGNISDFSTAALIGGMDHEEQDPDTGNVTGNPTEFNEYGNLKTGNIPDTNPVRQYGSFLNNGELSNAVREYHAMTAAYNHLNGTSVSNSRYGAFFNLAEEYVKKLAAAIVVRTYNDYVQARTNWNNFSSASSNADKAQRFSLVTGSIAALDSDQDMAGLQNIARAYINDVMNVAERNNLPHTGTASMLSMLGAAYTGNGLAASDMRNTINSIHTSTYHVYEKDGSTVVDEDENVNNRGWYARAKATMTTLRWQSGTYGFSVDYTNVKRRGTLEDIARTTSDVYTVNKGKMNTLVNKLDAFLASDDFATLIGADPTMGIHSLSEYIEDILEQNLFNDNMINTIISLVFPLLADLIDNQLIGVIQGLPFSTTPTDNNPTPDAAVSIGAMGIGDVDVKISTLRDLRGTVNIWLNGRTKNGEEATRTFAYVFQRVGVNIFPSTLRSYLQTIKVNNNVQKYPDSLPFMQVLNSAANWTDPETGKRDSWNYFDHVGDQNGKVDRADFDVIGVTWGANKYNGFVEIMGDIFGAAGNLLKAIFTSRTLQSEYLDKIAYVHLTDFKAKAHVLAWWPEAVEGNIEAFASGQLSIDGMDGYNTVWAPIFEALGISNTTTSLTVSNTNPLSSTLGTAGDSVTNAQLVNALFMPLYALVKKLADKPIATVLDILPSVAYHLAYNTVPELLKSLSTTLHVGVDPVITNVAKLRILVNLGGLADLLAGPISNALKGKIKFDPDLNIGSMISLDDMIPFDLSNLNSLVSFIFSKIDNDIIKGIELPAINTAKLAGMGTLKEISTIRNNGGHYKGANYSTTAGDGTITYQNKAYRIVNENGDYANVLYSLLKFIFTYATQDAEKLGALLSMLPAGLGSKLVQILKNDKPDEIIAGLVELFIPYGETAGLGEGSYKLNPYDWAQAITTSNTGDYNILGQGVNGAANPTGFVYLKYANDWTKEKAEYVYNEFDNVVNSVAELLEIEGLDQYGSVTDWLLKTVNNLFTNEGVESVLKLLLKLNATFDGESKALSTLLEKTVNVGGENLKISDWMKRFGYLYSDYRVLPQNTEDHYEDENGVTQTVRTEYFVYQTKTGDYAIGSRNYDSARVGEKLTKTQTSDGYEYQVVNAKYVLPVINFVSTYPLAPAGFRGFDAVTTTVQGKDATSYTLLGEGVSAAGTPVGATGSVLSTYKHVYQKYNGVRYDAYVSDGSNPDANYNKKLTRTATTTQVITGGQQLNPVWAVDNAHLFDLLTVDIMDRDYYDTHGTWLRWQITGDNNTALFGLDANKNYLLADGELGTETNATNAGISARAVFTGVFCELIRPVAPILNFLVTGRDLGFFKYGATNTLTIKGYDTYNGGLLPLLEALQVKGLMTSEQFANTYSTNASGGLYYLVNSLFEALNNILTDTVDNTGKVTKTALQKVIELLPPLFYYLESGGLTTLVHNVLMPVWVLVDTIRPLANVSLDDLIHQALCGLVKLNYDRDNTPSNAVADIVIDLLINGGTIAFSPYSKLQAKKDKNMVDAVYRLTLNDLGLEAIGEIVELFTGMDIAPIKYALEGMRIPYTVNYADYGLETGGTATFGVQTLTGQTQTKIYDIAAYNNNGSKNYTSKTLTYYGPDIITVLLSAVLDTLRYKDNAAKLDELIGLVADLRPGEALDTEVTATGLLEALEKVLLERDPASYEVPNWDYFLEGQKRVKISSDGNTIVWVNGDYEKLRQVTDFKAYHSINNLNAYRRPDNRALTDWTRDTAVATDKVLANILDFVTVSFLGKDSGAASFEEFVNDLLETSVFSGELLRTISGFVAQLFNFLPLEVVEAIDTLLDTSITEWAVPASGKSAFITPVDENGYPVAITSADIKSWVVNDENPYWRANRTPEGDLYEEDNAMYWIGPDYVKGSDAFLNALAEMLKPAAKLIAAIFLDDGYKIFYTAGDDLNTGSDDTDAIVLDGLGAYRTVLVPLFEALGLRPGAELGETIAARINPDDPNHHPLKSVSAFYDDATHSYKTSDFVDYLLKDVLLNFVNEVKADPVDYLLDYLPGILYFINAQGLSTAVKNLLKVVEDVVKMINNRLERSSRIDIGNLAGLDLSNLSLDGVLGLVEKMTSGEDEDGNFLAGLHVNDKLVEYIRYLYVGDLYYFDSPGHGDGAFSMKYSTAEDRADMITILVALLLEIAEDKDETGYANPYNNYQTTPWDNPAVIDRLANTDGMVTAIVKALTNPQILAEYGDIDWFYFDETLDLANKDYVGVWDEDTGLVTKVKEEGGTQEIILKGYAFQYLNYRTLWTYDKASSLTNPETLENLIVELLNMITGSEITRLNQLEINGIALGNATDLLTGDLLQKLISFLSDALYGNGGLQINDDITLTEDIIQLAGNLLGADLSAWNYQYQFFTVDHAKYLTDDTETGTEDGLTYYMLPIIVPDYDARGNQKKDKDGNLLFTTKKDEENNEILIKTFQVNGAEEFTAGLAKILTPASRLLSWLLFDDEYKFFVGNTYDTASNYLIRLPGSDGYNKGLALLLEALGLKGLHTKESYKTSTGYDAAAFIDDLSNSLVDRIVEILNDPIVEISGLISELIYFINAKGLQTVIQNLLAGPLALVGELKDLLSDVLGMDDDATDVFALVDNLVNDALAGGLSDFAGRELTADDIGFHFKEVNLDFVFGLLELITGLDLKGPAGDRLAYFRIGGLYHYVSVSDCVNAYKMQFTDGEDFADFVTILLSFLVDVITYEGNRDALVGLINRFMEDGDNKDLILQVIDAALELITKGFSTEIRDIDWFYFDPDNSIYDEDGNRRANEITKDTRFTLPARTINYLSYMSNWNEDLADYLYNGLSDGSLIDMLKDMISGVDIGDSGKTLYDLLKGGENGVQLSDFDFFGPGPLNSIADALGKIKIPEVVAELLDIVLSINLNGLGDENHFASQEDFDRYAATLDGELELTEEADNLVYANIGNWIEKLDDEGNVVKDAEGNAVMEWETDKNGDIVLTKTYLVKDKDSFVAGLCKLLSPLNVVLDWLLFGENTELKYFDKIGYQTDAEGNLIYDENGNPVSDPGTYHVLLSLKGANGYQYGLVPILEALGIQAPVNDGTKTTTEMLPEIINAAFDMVDGILSSDSPILSLIDLIPNILYFINANGLSASVHNLLAAPFALLDIINENITDETKKIDIMSLIQRFASNMDLNFTLDINHLDLSAIVNILEGLLSKTETDEEGNVIKETKFSIFSENGGFVDKWKIENFYFGKIEWFDSASGKAAFRMSSNEQETPIDMLTIVLNFAVEMILHKDASKNVDNAAAIDALINSDKFKITDIVTILENLKDDAVPGEYHWNYFNEADDNVEVARDLYGKTELFTAPKTPFLNYLTYATDWTEEFADDLYNHLPAIIDTVIGMLAKEDSDPHTLGEFVNSKLNIYTADTLNMLTGAIQKALIDEDGNQTSVALILDLVGLVLGTDLSVWKDLSFTDDQIKDQATFLAGLEEFLKPAYPVLDWLFFAGNLGFFVKDEDGNIVRDDDGNPIKDVNGNYIRGNGELVAVKGAEGYAYGLVPLLETLGVELPAYTVGSGTRCANILHDILKAVFDRVDAILADPVKEAVDLLPQLLYFINANGLATMVKNLLGGVVNAANELVASGLLDSVIADQLDGQTDIFAFLQSLLEKQGLSLNLNNLDLEGIFNFIENLKSGDELVLKGLKLNEVFTRKFAVTPSYVNGNEAYPEAEDGVYSNILEKFYIGTGARRVASSVTGYEIQTVIAEDGTKTDEIVRDEDGNAVTKPYYIYKMEGAGSGDVFTLLLSIVLEVVLWDNNEQPIADLLAGLMEGKTDAERLEAVQTLKAILAGNIEAGQGGKFNWAYFMDGPDYTDWTLDDLTTIEGLKAFTDDLLPTRTKNYLVYKNNWNEPLAEELFASIDDIANSVFELIPSIDADSIAEFIRDNLDLFNQENAEKVRDMIADLIGKIDASLLETAGALIGAEGISQIGETDMSYVKDAATFAQAMTEMVKPINNILSWLLFGGEYTFFTYLKDGETAMLTLKGGNGYNTGLAPILYMLGVDTDVSSAVTNEDKIALMIRNVCLRIDDLLYGPAPVDAILQLLPRLIYFINANGISASVLNLVAPVGNLLDAVNKLGLVDQDISLAGIVNSALGNIEALEGVEIDVNKIDFTTVFDIVEKLTGEDGLNLNGPLGDYLPYFYFGQIKHETINGFDEFTMVYSATEEKHDMFTILVSMILDVLSDDSNETFFVNLLENISEGNGQKIYTIIKNYLLSGDGYTKQYNMRDYAWKWLNIADTGRVISPLSFDKDNRVVETLYGPLYTKEMGKYMTKYLQTLINTYITLLGIENKSGGTYRSLDEMLDELIGSNIYTKSLLETITGAISGAVEGLKSTLGKKTFEQVVSLINKLLGVDLNTLLNYRVPANFKEGNQKAFVTEICKMLSPAAPILRFLLTGQDIAFFSDKNGEDYVRIRGAKGYEYAIVPIIEALYGGNPKVAPVLTQAEYEARTARPENGTKKQNEAADAAMLEYILNPILERVNKILQDPLTEIFAELPAIIYFIQSKGLDTAFKNLLNPAFELLTAVAPILADVEINGKKLYKTDASGNVIFDADGKAEPDLYSVIGLHLDEMDMEYLIDLLIGLIPSDASVGEMKLSDVVRDALDSLVLGKVVSFTSHRQVPETSANAKPGATGIDFAKDYTMTYGGSDDTAGTGSKPDMVTIILKVLLTFISQPGNVKVLEKLLKGKLNENGYKFLCSLLENFSQFASTPGGQDKIMYTVYYIFYAALTAGVATNNGLAKFNYNYSFMNQLFATSDLKLFKQMEASFGDLLDKWTGDVVDRDEVVPNGFIKFFQAIINFFKKIGSFFSKLFGR